MAIQDMNDEQEHRERNNSTWTFVSKVDIPHIPRLVIHARIVDSTFINISIDSPGSHDSKHLIDKVLTTCRRKYGRRAPRFPQSIFINLKSSTPETTINLTEQIDPLLLSHLPTAPEIFPSLSLPPSIPSTHLTSILVRDAFLLPNTRVVSYAGQKHVAKGPIYTSRIADDFTEIKNVLSLRPGCPYIIPRPSVLITVSEDDERLCGFLMPFYQRGNLDIYARRLRERDGDISTRKLLRWFRQLICAVRFLAAEETWHGDLKPDNLLVDDDENVVLTDFARKFATSATTSPEVHAEYLARIAANEEPYPALGLPSGWSIEALMRSEVYSICRTMYIVCEGISMEEIYHTLGWVNTSHTFETSFSSMSTTPESLRGIIERGTRREPGERTSLEELLKEVEGLERTLDVRPRRARADSKMMCEIVETDFDLHEDTYTDIAVSTP